MANEQQPQQSASLPKKPTMIRTEAQPDWDRDLFRRQATFYCSEDDLTFEVRYKLRPKQTVSEKQREKDWAKAFEFYIDRQKEPLGTIGSPASEARIKVAEAILKRKAQQEGKGSAWGRTKVGNREPIGKQLGWSESEVSGFKEISAVGGVAGKTAQSGKWDLFAQQNALKEKMKAANLDGSVQVTLLEGLSGSPKGGIRIRFSSRKKEEEIKAAEAAVAAGDLDGSEKIKADLETHPDVEEAVENNNEPELTSDEQTNEVKASQESEKAETATSKTDSPKKESYCDIINMPNGQKQLRMRNLSPAQQKVAVRHFMEEINYFKDFQEGKKADIKLSGGTEEERQALSETIRDELWDSLSSEQQAELRAADLDAEPEEGSLNERLQKLTVTDDNGTDKPTKVTGLDLIQEKVEALQKKEEKEEKKAEAEAERNNTPRPGAR